MSLSADQHAGRELVPLLRRGDSRGQLLIAEIGQQLPFVARRIYFVGGVPFNFVRGLHAHRELQQFAIAISGGVTMHMDDGRDTWRLRLDRPDAGICIPRRVWHEMHEFTADCVLMVLASEVYNEADYVRDRLEFEALVCG